MIKKSLLMVHTGDGKGKTTAALGLAFRAIGNGLKVCVIQFIKGSWLCGEKDMAGNLSERLDFYPMGRGFTWKSDDLEKDAQKAREAWEFAKEKIKSCEYELVILDELTYIISYNMVDESDIVDFLKKRPKSVHVLVTGRGATDGMIEAADMVTEMKNIKHHFKAGIKAQEGIEF